MRSSKSRSRSKQNRPRPLGNIVNRVFDSSGPEGKVRGTPQQIIEKYLVLARDAQLSNDRVAAENFLQHAEHYTRMLAEAQRELAAEQEARRSQHGHGGGYANGNGERGPERVPERAHDRPHERLADRPHERGPDRDRQGDRAPPVRSDEFRPRPDRPAGPGEEDRAPRGFVPVFPLEETAEDDSGLVETPEMRAETRPALPSRAEARGEARSDRRPEGRGGHPGRTSAPPAQAGETRAAASDPVATAAPSAASGPAEAPVLAASPAPAPGSAGGPDEKPRRSRAPRKPRADQPAGAAE